MELALRNSMEMVTKAASLKERRLEECITSMSEEVELQKSNVNTYEDACCALRDEEGGLRIKVVRLQSQVESARHREAVLVEGEVELQIELVKALETVKTINRKMAELVEHNSELEGREVLTKEELMQMKKELNIAMEALEQARLEQDKVEEQLERLHERSQKKEIKNPESSEVKELDEIARSEGGLVAVTSEVSEAAALEAECAKCSPALGGRLVEAAAQLSLLSSVICGQQEEDSCIHSHLLRCESEECLGLG